MNGNKNETEKIAETGNEKTDAKLLKSINTCSLVFFILAGLLTGILCFFFKYVDNRLSFAFYWASLLLLSISLLLVFIITTKFDLTIMNNESFLKKILILSIVIVFLSVANIALLFWINNILYGYAESYILLAASLFGFVAGIMGVAFLVNSILLRIEMVGLRDEKATTIK